MGRLYSLVLALPLAFPGLLAAQIKIMVQLSPATKRAFEKYVATEETKMDGTPRATPKPSGGVDLVPVGGSPIDVPNGLVHDWVGGVLIPGGSVDRALAMFRDYAGYRKVFAPEVLDSQLLSHDGDRWTSQLRFGRSAGLTTVAFDAEYAIQYKNLGDGRWAIQSRSTRISELDDNKRALANGNSQGFLWNLNSYWLIEPLPEGLYLECRAISLSRDIPVGLGWIVRPIIATVPRDSLRATVEEVRNALR